MPFRLVLWVLCYRFRARIPGGDLLRRCQPVRTAIATALAFLTACTAAPSDLLKSDLQVSFDSKRSPSAASECVGRNAEEFKSFGEAPFRASWRAGKEAGTWETIVYGGESLGTVVLAIAQPSSEGSSVTLWHRGLPALEIGKLLETMQNGC